jgi:hypothetical protein
MSIDNNNTCNDDGCSRENISYVKRTLGDDFIPLAIGMYKCLQSHFDSFFIACARTIIVCHQWSSLVPLMFVSYYQLRMSITLYRA